MDDEFDTVTGLATELFDALDHATINADLARRLVGVIDSLVTERLQSLGGAMLSVHGAGGARPDEHLASVGGYLLGRGHAEVLAELRDERYPAADPDAQQ